MFLLKWYKELLDIKYERSARKRDLEFCSACETLKLQLAIANEERKMLISKLTDKPEVVEVHPDTSTLKPINPKHMNWNVRRQMLEAEDREAAKLMRQKKEETKSDSKTDKTLTIHEIEKELGVVNE